MPPASQTKSIVHNKSDGTITFSTKALAGLLAAMLTVGGGGGAAAIKSIVGNGAAESAAMTTTVNGQATKLETLQKDMTALSHSVEILQEKMKDVEVLKATVENRFSEASRDRERLDRTVLKMDSKIDRLLERK